MTHSAIPSDVKIVSCDIETTGLERDDQIVSASIAWLNADGSIGSNFYHLDEFNDRNLDDERAFVNDLTKTLWDPRSGCTAIFHNISFDLPRIVRRFKPNEAFNSRNYCHLIDTASISRTLRNNKFTPHIDPQKVKAHALKYLGREFLGIHHQTFESVSGGKNIRFVDRSLLAKYNKADAEITLMLYLKFKEIAPPTVWNYYEEVERKQTLNLLTLDMTGVLFDVPEAWRVLSTISSVQEILAKDIFLAVGRSFNLASGDELGRAIFFNQNFTYGEEVLRPLYKTEKGRNKIDLDTLSELKLRLSEVESAQGIVTTLNKIMQYAEMAKVASNIDDKINRVVNTTDGSKIYANFNASAKSGRATTSRPNLLGLPKRVFKKSAVTDDIPRVPVDLRKASVRGLIVAPPGEKVISDDVSALDVAILADRSLAANPVAPLAEYFGRKYPIDIHMAMFSRMDQCLYERCLGPVARQLTRPLSEYFVQKMNDEKSSVIFVHKESGAIIETPFPSRELFDESSKQRDVFKTVNLSSGYLIGGSELATKIRKGTGRKTSTQEGKSLLAKFYEAYPEVRQDQDRVAQSVYDKGYVESVLGKRFYADCFDDLNAHREDALKHNRMDEYELVLAHNGDYYYVHAHGLRKQTGPVVENLKTTEAPFGFLFEQVDTVYKLPRYPFRKKLSALRSKFDRKNENSVDENSDYEENRIEITARIDEHIRLGTSLTSEAESLLDSFVRNGAFFIPEKYVLFYRVKLREPSSSYFRFYIRFIKVVRKFYPLLCQGIAAAVAAKCLTEVREFIEAHPEIGAKLILFVHDQIVLTVPEQHVETMKKVLKDAVESDKSPFRIRLSGKIECGDTYK